MPLTDNHRVMFMLRGAAHCVLPHCLYRIERELKKLTPRQIRCAEERAEYYCHTPLQPEQVPDELLIRNSEFRFPRSKPRHTTYFFPLRRLLNYFPSTVQFLYSPGDIYDLFAYPTLTKARHIGDDRATLLPLNAIRHFRFVTSDPTAWHHKTPLLVSRNEVHRRARIPFMERWFGHERTDLGQVNTVGGRPDLWLRPRMSVDEQLRYKFIACIEGNDVATNLKWVMSSNSLPVMPPPTMETWFMEGRLQPGVHYVALQPDFSDLLEQMDHYLTHPAEAAEMIRANHVYVEQFRHPEVEHATALLTLRRYLLAQL